jgi:hypothetical protein
MVIPGDGPEFRTMKGSVGGRGNLPVRFFGPGENGDMQGK